MNDRNEAPQMSGSQRKLKYHILARLPLLFSHMCTYSLEVLHTGLVLLAVSTTWLLRVSKLHGLRIIGRLISCKATRTESSGKFYKLLQETAGFNRYTDTKAADQLCPGHWYVHTVLIFQLNICSSRNVDEIL